MPTFTEIVTRVAARTNLRTPAEVALVGEFVNQRYRQVASSVGMAPVARTTATAVTTSGNRYLTFGPTPTPVVKILAVYDATTTPPTSLDERTVDSVRMGIVVSDKATRYAIYSTTAKSVTVLLNSASTTTYTLTADVLTTVTALNGLLTPNFSEDYHDILEYGALADVYDDKEKPTQAAKFETKYEDRLKELRYYLAKSAYLQIAQGIRQNNRQLVPVVQ